MHFSNISIAVLLSIVSSVLSAPVQKYDRYEMEENNGEYEMDHRYTDYPENYGNTNAVYRWDDVDYKRRNELSHSNEGEYVPMREFKYGRDRGYEHGYERDESDGPEQRKPLFDEEEPNGREGGEREPVVNEEGKKLESEPKVNSESSPTGSAQTPSAQVVPASDESNLTGTSDCHGPIGICIKIA